MAINVEQYTVPASEGFDRSYSLFRIGFQGAFMQAISGKDFSDHEACLVAGKLAYNYYLMDKRGSLFSRTEQDPEKANHLKQIMDGNYEPYKKFLSGFHLAKFIRNARGEQIPEENVAAVAKLKQFARRLPDYGPGWGALLDTQKDAAILQELVKLSLR